MGPHYRHALHGVGSTVVRSRYRFAESDGPFFMTCTVVAWMPIFTRSETVNIILDSWRYLQVNRSFVLYGYVILENHLHLVAEAPNISNVIGDFKSYTARLIIDHLRQANAKTVLQQLGYFKASYKTDAVYQLWQEGSHPQAINGDEIMSQKLDYIHNNPVERGYVDMAEHWRYSSARNYLGMPGLIEVKTDWRLD
jgi:REP element-mobilizing transposase RayT